MISLVIGLAYDSQTVNATPEQTLREVYESNELGALLEGNKTVAVGGTQQPANRVANKTLSELGVQDGDYVLVTENHKSA